MRETIVANERRGALVTAATSEHVVFGRKLADGWRRHHESKPTRISLPRRRTFLYAVETPRPR